MFITLLLAPLSRYTIASRRRVWLFGYAGYDTAALGKCGHHFWQIAT